MSRICEPGARRKAIAVRGESTNGRVASAGGPYARRGGAGDVGAHRRAAATKQTAPRRRNPKGAWVLLGSAIVRSPKVARPRMRAIAALLLLDDPHRDRLRRRALRSPHFYSPNWKFARSGTLRVNTHARDPLYFHHGLLDRRTVSVAPPVPAPRRSGRRARACAGRCDQDSGRRGSGRARRRTRTRGPPLGRRGGRCKRAP